MIDREKLKSVIEGYKKYFPTHWDDERYKWEAVKHFQDNWNVDDDNFGEMFAKATAKTFNLLASGYVYPRATIIKLAEEDNEAVRAMFKNLYDESVDLATRVESFQVETERLREMFDDGTMHNHYQNTNAISTYLWLRYPDKYYIYKYKLCSVVAKELDSDFIPQGDGSAESMIGGLLVYDYICSAISEDEQILSMLRSALTPDCYPDPRLKTATIDVAYYLANFYLKDRNDKNEKNPWYPKDYSPGISVEKWKSLLDNDSIFTVDSLKVMKRMKDFGGEATCAQLSEKYGESAGFYNRISSALAQRVENATGCSMPPESNSGEDRYWPIIYLGKKAGKNVSGNFIWRLRPELSEALDKVDLSMVELYEHSEADVTYEDNPYPRPESVLRKYTKEDFLAEVYMEDTRYDVLKALILNKKNVILQGAPGVGKTFTAKKLAYSIMGEKDDSRISMIQFHQNYTYEDFVMGYKPDDAGFKLTDGVFFRFCQKAASNPEEEYFFIIDEINRGNLSKIFGELLMLIEKDYRGTKATLAYSGVPFSVPKNLYLIGMMNTADRSLAMIDYALRRRFSFFEIEPGFTSEGFTRYQKSLQNECFDELINQIKVLNREIAEDKSLGRGFQIGHSYFCGMSREECTEDWLRSVVEFDIIPTLGEYWFDEPDTLRKWENNLRGVFDD